MNARALLAETEKAGVTLAATERGTLKYSGDPDALERLLPQIREHKTEILALLAANDPEPVKTSHLYLVNRPNGEQFSLSRNPPATLAEIEADYPGARIEPIPDPPPAPPLAGADLQLAYAVLRAWQETDTATGLEWIDGLARDPERLTQMHEQALALGVTVAVTLPHDDRRTCQQCRNLARNGRCLAAGRGELPLTSTRYEPFADRLERCIGFSPMADDVDQRPGNERYPGLHQRLWAMARAKS